MASVTMKMLSESSCALLLLTLLCALLLFNLLRYLQPLACNVPLALVKKMRNYWDVIKVGLPLYVHYVSLVFTYTNLLVQQLVAITFRFYSYESRYAWAAFGASCFHLLGAGSAYIVNKNKLQMFSFLTALILLGLAIFSITFESDNMMPAFYVSHLLQIGYGVTSG